MSSLDEGEAPAIPAGRTVRARLVIVQPYIPRYRVPFFDSLSLALAQRSVSMIVAAPLAEGNQSMREDDSAGQPWHRLTYGHRLSLGSGALVSYGARWLIKRADLAIVPAAGTVLDTHYALSRAATANLKVGLWGHIDSYVKPARRIDLAIEGWQIRRAHLVLAYTDRGALAALAAGAHSNNVVTVNNTIDTTDIVRASRDLTHAETQDFVDQHSLPAGRTFAYLGGLDDSKRIDLLSETLDVLWSTDPAIKVIVFGKGARADLLVRAANRGQVLLLGAAGPREKALIGVTSLGLLSPGRIGLVAVDALALGIPVISARFAFHAPEFDYLIEGTSLYQFEADAESYARGIRSLVDRADQLGFVASAPSHEAMVDSFVQGVEHMLDL